MSIHCDALMAQEPVNSEPSLEQALDQNLNNGSSAKTSPQDNVAPGVIKDSMLPGNGTTIPPAGPDLSKIVIPPNDPCLPVLYNDWQELSKEEQGGRRRAYAAFRIFINRTNLMLTFEGLRRDNMFEEIYSTHVGLGEINSPTPEGTYIINHIYCYPDVPVTSILQAKKFQGSITAFLLHSWSAINAVDVLDTAIWAFTGTIKGIPQDEYHCRIMDILQRVAFAYLILASLKVNSFDTWASEQSSKMNEVPTIGYLNQLLL